MPSFSSPRGPGQRRAAFPRGTKGTRGRISRGLLLSWETTSLLWVLNPEPKKSGMCRRGVGGWVGTKVEKRGHLLSSCQFATHLGIMMFPFLSLVFLCFLFFSTISMKRFSNKKNIIISSREREEFPRTHLSGCSALYFLYLSSPYTGGPTPPRPPWDLWLGQPWCGGEGGHGSVRSPRRGPASLMAFGLLCIPVRCTGHLYGPALVGWLLYLSLWVSGASSSLPGILTLSPHP